MSGDTDPRVEVVAAALYEHPPAWMSRVPVWSACPEAARGPWRAQARRVVAALDAADMWGPNPEPTDPYRRTP